MSLILLLWCCFFGWYIQFVNLLFHLVWLLLGVVGWIAGWCCRFICCLVLLFYLLLGAVRLVLFGWCSVVGVVGLLVLFGCWCCSVVGAVRLLVLFGCWCCSVG